MKEKERIYVNSNGETACFKKDDDYVCYIREDVVEKQMDELKHRLMLAERDVDNLSMRIYAKY